MRIKSSSDYFESLKLVNPVIYYKGKRITDVVSHSATAPHVRAAAMTYWEHFQSIRRFQKILEVMGVDQALREAGIRPGDTVVIGDHELEWEE